MGCDDGLWELPLEGAKGTKGKPQICNQGRTFSYKTGRAWFTNLVQRGFGLRSSLNTEKMDEDKRNRKKSRAKTLKLYRSSNGGLQKWSTLKNRLTEITTTAASQSTAGGQGKRRLTFSDLDNNDVEALKLIDAIKKSPYFETLPEKCQQDILNEEEKRNNRVQALETLAENEEGEGKELAESLVNRRQQDEENEENRLKYLWKHRSRAKNWTTLALFHIVILINIFIVMFESFEIIIQSAKLEIFHLEDDFNCPQIGDIDTSLNMSVNIIVAFSSVCVLFANRLEFSNILWAYIITMKFNIMLHVFEFFFTYRFVSTWNSRRSVRFLTQIAFEFLGIVLVVLRYYDMTNIIVKRENIITSSIYGGRILNEQIIYQNESVFLQRKFTLRQATAIQIYGVIQKIQSYRVRGMELEPKFLEEEVKAAISALNDVQGFDGHEMLKQLTLRNAPRNRAFRKRLDEKVRGDSELDITEDTLRYVY